MLILRNRTLDFLILYIWKCANVADTHLIIPTILRFKSKNFKQTYEYFKVTTVFNTTNF